MKAIYMEAIISGDTDPQQMADEAMVAFHRAAALTITCKGARPTRAGTLALTLYVEEAGEHQATAGDFATLVMHRLQAAWGDYEGHAHGVPLFFAGARALESDELPEDE